MLIAIIIIITHGAKMFLDITLLNKIGVMVTDNHP